VTTYRIGTPAEVRRRLEDALRTVGATAPVVRVRPRDRDHHACPLYAAHCYEVQAFHTTTNPDALDQLEQALSQQHGVYLTTQIRRASAERNHSTNPAWPAALGPARRGFHALRASVLALARDPGPSAAI
jgi:hypothetical protein